MKNNINYTAPKLLFASAALLFAACLSSCSKKDDSAAASTASSFVLAVNAAEGSDSLNFYADNNKLTTTALPYTASTEYVDVKAGTHQLSFKSTGTGAVSSSAALTAAAGKYYTAFYVDDKSTLVIPDDRTTPDSAKARIRFVNLSSGINSAVDIGITDSAKMVSGLAYKTASAYSSVNANTRFSLYLAGAPTVALSIPLTVEATRVYTVYISGATPATLTYHVLIQNYTQY